MNEFEIILLLIVGGLLFAYRKKLTDWVKWNVTKKDYPVKLLVIKRRGMGTIWQMDKGKLKHNKKLDKDFYDTVRNGEMPRLSIDGMSADAGAILYERSPNEFVQANINDMVEKGGELQLEPLGENQKSWYSDMIKMKERYQISDKLTQFLPVIGLIVMVVGILILYETTIPPLFEGIEKVSQSNEKIADALAKITITNDGTVVQVNPQNANNNLVNKSGIPY